jgi:hypothetical protein
MRKYVIENEVAPGAFAYCYSKNIFSKEYFNSHSRVELSRGNYRYKLLPGVMRFILLSLYYPRRKFCISKQPFTEMERI